MVVKLGLSH